jgi:hypothetical protein
MNIELPSDAEAWIRRGIAEGRFLARPSYGRELSA